MTMIVDGIEVSLVDKPHTSSDFCGHYTYSSSSGVVIDSVSGNTYSIGYVFITESKKHYGL